LAEIKAVSSEKWTGAQAFGIATACLLLGLAGGRFIKKTLAPVDKPSAAAASPGVTSSTNAPPASLPSAPPSQQLSESADAQAAPLLAQLQSDPNNAGLLESIGNMYYDAQLYSAAIDYYRRCLNIQPSNTSVRTDMGTAIWYTGNADGAISEFNKSLAYEPTKADTLFNLGIVLWQGKHDAAGAVAAWQKLLAANPNYENKEKVQQLIAEARK